MTQYWIVGCISLALIMAAYITGRHDGSEMEKGRNTEIVLMLKQAQENAQRGAAQAIAQIDVKNVTLRQTIEKEIHEKPVYTDCRVSADGLRLVNAALTGTTFTTDRGVLPRLDANR